MVSAMSEHVPDAQLHSVTGRFHRPVGGEFAVEADVRRRGREVTILGAKASSSQGIHAEATAVYGRSRPERWPTAAPEPPAAPPPEQCEIYAIPPEFVPISAFMQIRPVGPNRPYAGGREPELTAWIRLLEDERPPDLLRFVLLMDALAPSYAAVLSDLVFIPTVELTVRPGGALARTGALAQAGSLTQADALARAGSPWVLLRARTHAADADGWNEETIEAWGPDGSHLGSARQLRVVRAD